MGGGISNSKVVTEEGKYSLDAVQNNPNIPGSLRNELNTKMTSGKEYATDTNIQGLANDETVEVSLNLPEGGLYLIQANIAACGANALTKESPFFNCQLFNNSSIIYINARSTFNINISKIWDSDNIVTFIRWVNSGTVGIKFTNKTGGQLSTEYNSNFGIHLVKL